MTVTIEDIRRARELIAGQVQRTPLIAAPKLSALTGAELFVKYENLQVTNSFKDRGALVKLLSLDKARKRRGVIAMSAGNHAQAVAYHAARLDIPATIVMPVTTPFIKVANTEEHGAAVVLEGETLAEAQVVAELMTAERNATFIHPYDDELVIACQGTIALEMLEEQPDLDCLIVPVGGGGLIAGSAVAAKALKPDIEIVGVEAELYPAMAAALKGEAARCGGQTLAEGIAVKNVGKKTLAIARQLVAQMVLVSETDLERAVAAYLTLQKTMAEGAGAAGLAAMLRQPERFKGRKVGLILSGGNIDPRMLASIMMRQLERENRIVSFRVTISDRPGILGQIATLLGNAGANILEVSHQRLLLDVPAKGANLDMMIEVRDAAHAEAIFAAMRRDGFNVIRLDTMGVVHMER